MFTYFNLNSLEKVEVNKVSNLVAMGLEKQFVSYRAHCIAKETKELIGASPQEWQSVAESLTELFERRLAAGRLLALVGDPRIRILDPQMVTVPAAVVAIGRSETEAQYASERYKSTGCKLEWLLKECPAVSMEMKAFKIARYPVTNLEYREFLCQNPQQEAPSSWLFGRYPCEYSNVPVFTVSAEAAAAYAAWLSSKTGRSFRLPTEFEWEYAATGGQGREFPWGDEYEDDKGNCLEFGFIGPTPVGIFAKGVSAFGCMDMSGNVEEYTSSTYAPYTKAKAIMDDLALQNPDYPVARGGSFTRFRDLMRCQRRHGQYPSDIYCMGFRLAETVAE